MSESSSLDTEESLDLSSSDGFLQKLPLVLDIQSSESADSDSVLRKRKDYPEDESDEYTVSNSKASYSASNSVQRSEYQKRNSFVRSSAHTVPKKRESSLMRDTCTILFLPLSGILVALIVLLVITAVNVRFF